MRGFSCQRRVECACGRSGPTGGCCECAKAPGAREPIACRTLTKEIEMHTIRRSRSSFIFIATLLAGALFAPVSVNAEDQVLALAPVAGPSWDEESGYRSVEASRIAVDVRDQPDAFAAVATGTWDEMSGYASVEAS